MKINPRGYWEEVSPENHGHDAGLAYALEKFLRAEGARYVVDIGCGDGWYTTFLNGMAMVTDGFDGNPDTREFAGMFCDTLDFSKPVTFEQPYDWALSLEVGEHIPAEFEDIFITNVVNSCSKGVILSWSIPEYGGEGHVNPHTNEYIWFKLAEKGFEYDLASTELLRDSVAVFPTPCYWFRNTLMVFRRKNG